MVIKKFEENLIELSKKNTWEEASKEWGFLYKRERDTKDNHCLCGYKLKHQYYYYNKNTKKIICAGMACKTHIDDYRGNKEYNSDFISDLNALGNERVVDYDLEAYCIENEQRVFDRFFWRIDMLELEKQLNFYYDYIEEYWSELLNVDVILERINEKLQIIFDREAQEQEKKEECLRLAEEREQECLRLARESLLLKKQKEQKRVIMSKKRRKQQYIDDIVNKEKEIAELQKKLYKITEDYNKNIRACFNELVVLRKVEKSYII